MIVERADMIQMLLSKKRQFLLIAPALAPGSVLCLSLPVVAAVGAPAGAFVQDGSKASDEALWTQLDRNQSGWLSGNELDGGWVRYDRDADGEVTKAEFFAGRGAEAPARQTGASGASNERNRALDAALFVKLDTSGEGYLDGGELEKATLLRYDANGDGRVVLLEFAAGRAGDRGSARPISARPSAGQKSGAARAAQRKAVAASAPGRSLPPGRAIDTGLYFRIQQYFNGTSLSINQEHFAFWSDGRLYRGVPSGGLEFFDYAAARQKTPGNCGTYSITGDKITFTMADGKSATHGFKRAPGGFNLDGIFTSRQKSYKPGQRLAGLYDGGASVGGGGNGSYVASVKSLTFAADGTFQGSTIGALSANTAAGTVTGKSETADSGTYALGGNTLTLRHQGGPVTRHTVYPYDLGGGKTAINVDGVMLHPRR